MAAETRTMTMNMNRTESGESVETTYTMDQAVDVIGFGPFHRKLLVLCGVGYLAEIIELVVVSFVAPSIQRQMGLSNFQYSLLGSSSFVGMAVGALFWGYVSDHFGRKLSFTLTVWLTFIGGFLSALSPNYATLLFLRFLAAFGIGGMLPVDYTVFLEFLPEQNRGSYIVLVDAIGVVPALTMSATIAWYFSGEVVNWRAVLMLSSVPVGVMAVLRGRHVPESPRYYQATGETDQAQRVVQEVADANSVQLPDNWRLLSQQEEEEEMLRSGYDNNDSMRHQDGQSSLSLKKSLSSKAKYSALPSENENNSTTTEVELSPASHSSQSLETRQQDDSRPLNPSLQTERDRNDHSSDGNDGNGQNRSTNDTGNQAASSEQQQHQSDYTVKLLTDPRLRMISYRLWIVFFCVQLSSSGMVFALPKLFDDTFPGKTEREIALDLLIGVVGLIPGLGIAFNAVEWSRTRTLALFFAAAGVSVLLLGYAFLVNRSQKWALLMSMILRGCMEGCFALANTTAVESYPTLLRATGLGTAQIFDHIAGSISPLIFGFLDASPATRPYLFVLYALAYFVATIPALSLGKYANVR